MTIRTLTSKDIFPICGILRKIGVKEFKTAFNNPDLIVGLGEKKMSDENMLIAASLDTILDIAAIVISNLPTCEKEIYAFLVSVVEEDVTVKDLQEMPMADFAKLIKEVFTKEEFKDFFKVALGFLK